MTTVGRTLCEPLCHWPSEHVALVGDVQHLAAGLAVDSVGFMLLQAANRAGKPNLVRLQQGAQQAQEQGNPEDHNDDGDQSAAGSSQRDISKACRRECRDGKIERIDVIVDFWIGPVLGLVNDARHDEQEDD